MLLVDEKDVDFSCKKEKVKGFFSKFFSFIIGDLEKDNCVDKVSETSFYEKLVLKYQNSYSLKERSKILELFIIFYEINYIDLEFLEENFSESKIISNFIRLEHEKEESFKKQVGGEISSNGEIFKI